MIYHPLSNIVIKNLWQWYIVKALLKRKRKESFNEHAIVFALRKNMRVTSNSIDYYILPNKMMCSVFGISSTDGKYSTCGKIFAYFRLTCSLTSFSNIFLPQIALVVANWGDIKILTGVGCVTMTLVQYIFKLIYLIIRRKRAYQLYKKLRSLWDATDDPEERRSYETFAYWSRISSIIIFSLGVWIVIMYNIVAGIDYLRTDNIDDADRARYLAFEVWYGTDLTELDYKIAFVCQFLGGLLCATGVWGVDTSCMTTILHVSGQFKLINTWISNMGAGIESENCLPKVKANLIKCVRHHQRMLNIVDEVNNLLTPIIFFQILTSGIEICLSGFLVVNSDSTEELLKSIFYLATMTSQLLLWCWPSEILIQESEEVGQAAYLNVPWYKLPPIYRSQLLLIIVRSQRQCSISGFTFQRLSFHTLTSVFNTAASYFALLNQMQAK